jgi:hypothetical protein
MRIYTNMRTFSSKAINKYKFIRTQNKKPDFSGFFVLSEYYLFTSIFYRFNICRPVHQLNQCHRCIVSLAEAKLQNT